MTTYTGTIPMTGITMTPGNGTITSAISMNRASVSVEIINNGSTIQITPIASRSGSGEVQWEDDSSNSFSFSWSPGSDKFIVPPCNA